MNIDVRAKYTAIGQYTKTRLSSKALTSRKPRRFERNIASRATRFARQQA